MFHRPVLVTAPAAQPITLTEAKAHLRVQHSSDDTLITSLIAAATEQLDGWSGILGRCLEEQSWRQDYDSFAQRLPLPLAPVISITSVTVTNEAGTPSTIDSANYELQTDAGGSGFVRFDDDYQPPSDQAETRAFKVTYKAGYTPSGGNSTVPAPIRAALLLMIGHLYEHREEVVIGTITAVVPRAVDSLLAPWRRVGL